MKRFYNNEKNIIVFIDFVICADTCMGGYSTRGPKNLPLLMTKQVWEINDYLVQAGIANSSYVHYPECNDVVYFLQRKSVIKSKYWKQNM